MKKIISMLLLFAMLVSFASCHTSDMEETSSSTATMDTTETTDTTEHTQTTDTSETADTTETSEKAETVVPEVFFEVPSDEKEVTKTIVTENADGMKMEITLHGYASEKLEKEFYVKHDEVVTMDVKITNTSDHTNRQFLPTYCRNSGLGDYRHNHEITVDITSENGNELTSCAVFGACPEMYDMWDIEVGESYDFKLEYVAGKVYYDERDDAPKLCDIPLYGNEIYPDGTCDFTGTLSFAYCEEFEDEDTFRQNDRSLSADVAFEIVYVKRAKTTAFVRPEDQKYQFERLFSAQNEDIKLEVAFSGIYASESLGEEAYFKRGENIYGFLYVTNISDHSIYFDLSDPIEMVGYSEPTEFDINLKTNTGYVLGRLKGDSLPDFSMERIELKPGEMFMREVQFAAGEYTKGYYIDEHGNDCYTDGGFRYYGIDAYTEGKMSFKGTVSFWRYFDSPEAWENGETKSLGCDVCVTCFYVPIKIY